MATATTLNDPAQLSAAGMAYLRQGRAKEAVEAFTHLVQLLPASVPAQIQLAQALIKADQTEAAAACLHRIQSQAGNDASAWANIGGLLVEVEKFTEGIAALQRAIELDAGSSRAYSNLAIAYQRAGREEEGFQALNHALRLAPHDVQMRSRHQDAKLHLALSGLRSTSIPPKPMDAADQEYARQIAAQVSRTEAPLTAVFYHVSLANSHEIQSLQAGQAVDYIATIAAAVVALRARVTGANIVILTDPATAFPSNLGADTVVRIPVKPEWIMYERMRAERAFADAGVASGNTLFLDTDIVVNRDPAPLFQNNFDVGLTWRPDFHLMPVNEGVLMCRQGSHEMFARFLSLCLGWYDFLAGLPAVNERYDFDIRKFRGGQLSLAAAIGWRMPPHFPDTLMVAGIRCKLFPCREANHTYQPGTHFDSLAEKYAIHFKGGKAKSDMTNYVQHMIDDTKTSVP